MLNINELKFDAQGLIPAVVVDAASKKVLTLAYMNRESLEISMKEGRTCFWSRSRQELWRKGETSGNVQHIVDITADCDRDALVVRVNKEGPAWGPIPASTIRSFRETSPSPSRWRGCTPCCKAGRRHCRRAPTPLTCSRRGWTKF